MSVACEIDACVDCWLEGETRKSHVQDCLSHRPVRIMAEEEEARA